MAKTLRDERFRSCSADPNVWMEAERKPNGDKHSECVVVCADDTFLVASHSPQRTMDASSAKKHTLKAGSEHETSASSVNLRLRMDSDDHNKTRWGMPSDMHVKRAVADVEQELKQIGKASPTLTRTPSSQGCRPEIDTTPKLDDKQANCHQGSFLCSHELLARGECVSDRSQVMSCA